MPFVARKVEPRLVCRGHVPDAGTSDWALGAELEAVANGALSASLRQMASLMIAAEDVFSELTRELAGIAERGGRLRTRIDALGERLRTQDPKKIPVPESDICTFAARTVHWKSSNEPERCLFTLDSRPKVLKQMYEAAASIALRSLDSLRRERDAISPIDMFICTPVMSKRRRDHSLDIEARRPRAVEQLRRWTSDEALGEVTVAPDGASRILCDDSRPVDHTLPSPEEQLQAIALKFPAELVAVDVSGRGFRRMSLRRKSLHGPEATLVRRRSRPRRPRAKRRNTIAGTDHNEIREAATGEVTQTDEEAIRSVSIDLLEASCRTAPPEKKSHLDTLKAWGRSGLKLISPRSSQHVQDPVEDLAPSRRPRRESSRSHDRKSSSLRLEQQQQQPEERQNEDQQQSQQQPPQKHQEEVPKAVGSRRDSVRLRESAAERRERRKARAEEPPHSSSGNWSASSESGRASVGSESTSASTGRPARSTTTTASSAGSSCARVARRPPGGRDTSVSASSSVTSEGTLTPDITHDVASAMPFCDDAETSSVYSCDTEGYYTSFHVDSGLKTLREEEPAPSQQQSRSVESEYELYGRGSTSTTTSSAGTVCTTLLAPPPPPPPERKSSLAVAEMQRRRNSAEALLGCSYGDAQKQHGGESPDSGHNTSSSPVESASSPACTGRSCSEFEYSESSDLEGCERIERIRSKTAINTSRIPSMCVITPPNSDDEQRKEQVKGPLPGSVLMSATVGTSKMQVINGQDKNLYATVQTLASPVHNQPDKGTTQNPNKVSPLSGVLGKLRGVLPAWKQLQHKPSEAAAAQADSGDYVTIADVRNNNKRPPQENTYANSDLFRRDAEYVSLSELPKKADSSLERRRQGARVTLDSDGKVVYSSDSLKRRKGAHTTFIPGPFVKDGNSSPAQSPLLRRGNLTPRAVTRTNNAVDKVDGISHGEPEVAAQVSPQHRAKPSGKLVIRAAAKSPERDTASSPEHNNNPASVQQSTLLRQGAYVNMQAASEDKALLAIQPSEQVSTATTTCSSQQQQQQLHNPPPYVGPPQPHKLPEHHHHHHQQQQFNRASNDGQQTRRFAYDKNQFYTLPNPRTQRQAQLESARSISPEMSRPLPGGPLSAAHMLARQRHQPPVDPNQQPLQQHQHQQQPSQVALDLKSRLAYRLFATQTQHVLGGLPISPIGPTRPGVSFGSSTPTLQQQLQPRSVMSNEELFAAIHRSKRRLNIREDPGVAPPAPPAPGPPNVAGARHSWSPQSAEPKPQVPATSRLDFKRLLLAQSVRPGPSRLSAAERLRQSRRQAQQRREPTPPEPEPAKLLSPRSTWRFQTPRSDVLSATILEEAAAEERAEMKRPPLEKRQKELHNRLQLGDANREPLKALESRRLSNQLARAQFLAGPAAPAAPTPTPPPEQSPALETAL